MLNEYESFNNDNIIDKYTREQAIEDNVLIDITYHAQLAGFKYSTAISHSLWYGYIDLLGDTESRLWELLWILWLKTLGTNLDTVKFNMSFWMPNHEYQLIEIVAVCGPGDKLEPVITICLPEDL